MLVLSLYSCTRGDRDLGVAFQTHPGSQASSRGEAKDSALPSGPDRKSTRLNSSHSGQSRMPSSA